MTPDVLCNLVVDGTGHDIVILFLRCDLLRTPTPTLSTLGTGRLDPKVEESPPKVRSRRSRSRVR